MRAVAARSESLHLPCCSADPIPTSMLHADQLLPMWAGSMTTQGCDPGKPRAIWKFLSGSTINMNLDVLYIILGRKGSFTIQIHGTARCLRCLGTIRQIKVLNRKRAASKNSWPDEEVNSSAWPSKLLAQVCGALRLGVNVRGASEFSSRGSWGKLHCAMLIFFENDDSPKQEGKSLFRF